MCRTLPNVTIIIIYHQLIVYTVHMHTCTYASYQMIKYTLLVTFKFILKRLTSTLNFSTIIFIMV